MFLWAYAMCLLPSIAVEKKTKNTKNEEMLSNV
jgi:hypothetical protein